MTDRDALRDKVAKWMYERDATKLCWPEDSRRAWDRLVPKLREPWEKDADSILALIEPLVGALRNVRDCAKGIMPIHTDMASLRDQIISLNDARWTQLFAIYAEADAALVTQECRADDPVSPERGYADGSATRLREGSGAQVLSQTAVRPCGQSPRVRPMTDRDALREKIRNAILDTFAFERFESWSWRAADRVLTLIEPLVGVAERYNDVLDNPLILCLAMPEDCQRVSADAPCRVHERTAGYIAALAQEEK